MGKNFWTLIDYGRSLGLRMAVAPSVTPLLSQRTMLKIRERSLKCQY